MLILKYNILYYLILIYAKDTRGKSGKNIAVSKAGRSLQKKGWGKENKKKKRSGPCCTMPQFLFWFPHSRWGKAVVLQERSWSVKVARKEK
jgi:hypothetical protein